MRLRVALLSLQCYTVKREISIQEEEIQRANRKMQDLREKHQKEAKGARSSRKRILANQKTLDTRSRANRFIKEKQLKNKAAAKMWTNLLFSVSILM